MQSQLPTLNIEYIYFFLYQLFLGSGEISGRYILSGIVPYSIIISILLAIGVTYCIVRIRELRVEYYARERAILDENKETAQAQGDIKNEKWQRVLEHLSSEKEGDWRLAILEADVMLEEMANIMGYQGDTLGEKLRGVEKSDFITIDNAWEAHRIRNRIAHQGSDFSLTEREAKRVIELYKSVFDEFRYI
jgi:uncharacterized membrane protein